MLKEPTVLSFANPALGLKPRTLMLGIKAFGASRAFSYDEVIKEKLVMDHVGSEPVLLVVGPDGQSVRAFRGRVPGIDGEPSFYSTFDAKQSRPSDLVWLRQAAGAPLLMDDVTGGAWNFEGCALSGKASGVCLERVNVMKDYWFDWRNYNPDTTVYAHKT